MASCRACIVRSSSSSFGAPHGLLKPLDNSRSESFDTRSSRSISSSRSPVYFVYLNFTSVVILFPAATRRHARLFIEVHFARRLAHRRLGAVIPALVAAADLARGIQRFEHEIDPGCDHRS